MKKVHDVWVARLNDEEEKRADEHIIDQLRDELEMFWVDLKEEFLKEGGQQ